MRLLPLLLLFMSCHVYAEEVLEVCIDYHCEKMQRVQISSTEWQQIAQPFAESSISAEQERQQIQQSIALFEQIVGKYTPNHADLEQNEGEDETGQLDCIAESTNTLLYLRTLASKEKLKWHIVNERTRRAPYLFDVHWGVKITTRSRPQAYVVDSWYGANGDSPIILPLSLWLKQ